MTFTHAILTKLQANANQRQTDRHTHTQTSWLLRPFTGGGGRGRSNKVKLTLIHLGLCLPTSTAAAGGEFTGVCLFVCLSVCLYARTISQKPTQLGSPNLTQKCSTTSPGKPFILGSKGQRSRSRVTKTVPEWDIALLWVLASYTSTTVLKIDGNHTDQLRWWNVPRAHRENSFFSSTIPRYRRTASTLCAIKRIRLIAFASTSLQLIYRRSSASVRHRQNKHIYAAPTRCRSVYSGWAVRHYTRWVRVSREAAWSSSCALSRDSTADT